MKLACAVIGIALICPGLAPAQGWAPQKNVEIVVPNVPGGTNDKLARAIERTLTAGQQVPSVSVVNRAGAGGQLTYAYVNQQAGNPHVLAIGTPSLLTAQITGVSKLGYTDLTSVASIFNDYIVLAVNESSAVRTGKDLVARLRSEPAAMTLGFSSQLGNHHHISAGLLMKAIQANVRELKPVIFKGSAEALTALLGAHIQMVSTGAGNAVPHAATGKLRIVGVSSGQRLPGSMAGVPTWKEQGVDMVYGSWRIVIAPAGITPAQVAYWEGALRKASDTPDWKAELERNFWTDYFLTGAALKKSLDREYSDTRAVLVDLGLAK
jgi:putative tricarboxylic transport membrane protein